MSSIRFSSDRLLEVEESFDALPASSLQNVVQQVTNLVTRGAEQLEYKMNYLDNLALAVTLC